MEDAVLLFETHPALADRVSSTLLRADFEITRTASREHLLTNLTSQRVRVVVVSPSPSLKNGEDLELVRSIRDANGLVAVVLVVADSSEDLAIAALRAGVNEYVRFPLMETELPPAVARCLRLTESEEAHAVAEKVAGGIVGDSSAMRTIRARIEKIALLAWLYDDRHAHRGPVRLAVCSAGTAIQAGGTLGFTRNRFVGSYLAFSWRRRSWLVP